MVAVSGGLAAVVATVVVVGRAEQKCSTAARGTSVMACYILTEARWPAMATAQVSETEFQEWMSSI